MSEYPHIYQEMKNLAIHRQEKDLSMIEDSMNRAKQANLLHDSIVVETFMEKLRGKFESSKCTEIDNHAIVPLNQMFEEMKEKLPLEELLDNFDVSGDENKEGADKGDSDSSEVQFEDVASIGLEKMYSQFQDLNQNLKNKLELQTKIDNNNQYNKPGLRGNKRMPTYIDNTKGLDKKNFERAEHRRHTKQQ